MRAGTSGVELRLAPPSFFTVEVRDEQERPVESESPHFDWLLAGHRVEDYPHHGPSWARSPVPFFVRVSPYEYKDGQFGPFDPASVGERLVLHVERYPCLRGRVTLAGAAIEDADVLLLRLVDNDEEARFGGTWQRVVHSDEEGRFDFNQFAGRYELWARSPAHGESAHLSLDLDGVHDRDGIELELDRSFGAIEGQVTVPAGHVPAEVALWTPAGLTDTWVCARWRRRAIPPARLPAAFRSDRLRSPELGHGRRAFPFRGERRPARLIGCDPSVLHRRRHARARPRIDIDLASPPRCRLAGVSRERPGRPALGTPRRLTARTGARLELRSTRTVASARHGELGPCHLLQVQLELEGAQGPGR